MDVLFGAVEHCETVVYKHMEQQQRCGQTNFIIPNSSRRRITNAPLQPVLIVISIGRSPEP